MGLGVAGSIAAAGTAVSAGTAIAGGVMGSNAAKSGAQAQEAAASQAASQQSAQYQQTRADLSPYNVAGQNALSKLATQTGTGDYTGQGDYGLMTQRFDASAQGQDIAKQGFTNGMPFNMSPDALAQTPGYAFQLKQGLQAAQNSAAARGLGVSGSALRAASDYATGLSNSTWKDQAANYYQGQSNYNNAAQTYYAGQTNAYNKLMGVANTGENAAATTGSQGQQSAAAIGNDLTGAGNAAAAGGIGSANAIGSVGTGVATAANSYQQNMLLQSALNNQNGVYSTGNDGSGGTWV